MGGPTYTLPPHQKMWGQEPLAPLFPMPLLVVAPAIPYYVYRSYLGMYFCLKLRGTILTFDSLINVAIRNPLGKSTSNSSRWILSVNRIISDTSG